MKLGALIALNLNDEKPKTTKEKIALLNSFNLDYKIIASIIGSSESNVAKEISLIKKVKGKKKK